VNPGGGAWCRGYRKVVALRDVPRRMSGTSVEYRCNINTRFIRYAWRRASLPQQSWQALYFDAERQRAHGQAEGLIEGAGLGGAGLERLSSSCWPDGFGAATGQHFRTRVRLGARTRNWVRHLSGCDSADTRARALRSFVLTLRFRRPNAKGLAPSVQISIAGGVEREKTPGGPQQRGGLNLQRFRSRRARRVGRFDCTDAEAQEAGPPDEANVVMILFGSS